MCNHSTEIDIPAFGRFQAMPIAEDPYYCHEQIEIPPPLPDILKMFTKAAIRTQPKDPLAWSYE